MNKERHVEAIWKKVPADLANKVAFADYQLDYKNTCVYFGVSEPGCNYRDKVGKVLNTDMEVVYEANFTTAIGGDMSNVCNEINMQRELKLAFRNQVQSVAEYIFMRDVVSEYISDNFEEINMYTGKIVPDVPTHKLDFSESPMNKLYKSIDKFLMQDGTFVEAIPAGGYKCLVSPNFTISICEGLFTTRQGINPLVSDRDWKDMPIRMSTITEASSKFINDIIKERTLHERC